jgi:LPS export ABC transporter protein LptC
MPPYLGYAALLLLAAGSWYLARRDEAAQEPSAYSTQTGYYLRDASLEQADDTGRINLRAHAAEAVQAGDDGTIDLRTLRVDYVPRDRHDWLMTANHGELPRAARTIHLDGDVRLSAPELGAAVVRTQTLLFNVDTELATTSDAVSIDMPPHVVHARGMRADLRRETVRLEAAVNGTFSR